MYFHWTALLKTPAFLPLLPDWPVFSLLSMAQTGLKKFLEYVQLGTSDKVARLLDKGLDPNYHDSDSGGKEENQGLWKRWGAEKRGIRAARDWPFLPLRDPPDAGSPDRRLRRGDSNPVPGRGPHRLPGPGWHDRAAQGRVCPSLPGSHGEVPDPGDPPPDSVSPPVR